MEPMWLHGCWKNFLNLSGLWSHERSVHFFNFTPLSTLSKQNECTDKNEYTFALLKCIQFDCISDIRERF